MTGKILVLVLLVLSLLGNTQAGSVVESGYIPHRVFNSEDKKFRDFEMMMSELAKADVVFVGEQHDDPATHHLELAILEGLARRRGALLIAMEMFERDTQPVLDNYLAGKISEAEFLKSSRPWPNYATDYRPIVEFAKARGWGIIAGNVPRKYASQVARSGLAALETLPESERRFFAAEVKVSKDDYFKRFVESMSAHPGNPLEKKSEAEIREMVDRFYQAQCVKDETMAESLARAYQNAASPKPLIVHFNGAFHSDYHLGTAARVGQHLEKARIEVISIVPLEQLDTIKTDDYRKRGDYIVFALRAAKSSEKK